MSTGVLGIIAGGGELPVRLVEACKQHSRPYFILAFEGAEVSPTITPHACVRFGAIGEALEILRAAGVRELVLAGSMRRPSLLNLRPDATAARLLGRLGAAFFSGDDALLSALVKFLEEEGFIITGADEILEHVLTPTGVLGAVSPSAQDMQDIEKAFSVAKTLGALDVGQAVIVQNGCVLGVEAAEGTDALITRCAALKLEGCGGVLVKVKKPEQDRRVDLPTIGVSTVEQLHKAGFAGIAVEAGGSQIIDREETVKQANISGIFIMGIQQTPSISSSPKTSAARD